MESLVLATKVVFPLVVYMIVGWIIRKKEIMEKEHFKRINAMVFKVILPIGIFFDIYETDLGEVFQPKVFLFVAIGTIVVFAISWIIISRMVKNNADASVMIQGIYRSNYALFGVTIAKAICDAEGIALAAALTAIVIPVFNVLAVVLFETKRGGEVKFTRVFLNILKNPLIVASISGGAAALLGITIPEILSQPLIKLGDTASPLALVALGGMLSVGSVIKHRKYLFVVVLGKLVLTPGIMLAAAALMGMRGSVLVALLSVFGSPTAVSSAPMAQTMGGNGELAGEIVAITSVCCILTVFLFVFGMSQMGLIW